jgi:uncharacterized protein (TIGR03437 family)
MRHFIVVLLSAAALYATPQLRLSTSTVGPLDIAVGQNGPTQTVVATNIGSGTLALSASANVSWINATTTGSSVLLALNTSTLAQGIFTGLVTVSATGAIDAPQTIAVTVQMGGGVPNSLTFYVQPGFSASTGFVASNELTASVAPPSGGLTLAIVSTGGGSFQTTGSYLVTAGSPATAASGTSYTGTIDVTSSKFAPDVKKVPVTINVTSEPIAVMVQPSIQFNVGQGAAPVEKWIQLGNVGASALTVTGATITGTSTAWLTVTVNGACQIAGVAQCVVATGDPTGLTPGPYTATVAIASNAANGPLTVPVEMDVVTTTAPWSYYQGVVDNAVYQIGATVAPGELVAVRGEQFTTGAAVAATSLPLGTSLGSATESTAVYVNGAAVPVYYVAASHVENQGGQITFQMPYSTPSGSATVQVVRNDNGTLAPGNTISVPVKSIVPELLQFSLNVSGNQITTVDNIATESPVGTQYAVATFTDFVTFPIPTTAGVPSRPANPGDVLVFYGLGFGQTTPAVTEGIAVAGQATVGNCLMVFGGETIVEGAKTSAVPSYCGLTPSSVGLYQVNVAVPAGTPVGSAVPVYLQIGSATSNTVAIAVQ